MRIELAASNGSTSAPTTARSSSFHAISGGRTMQVEIREYPALRVGRRAGWANGCRRVHDGSPMRCYEVCHNTPMDTPKEQLRTELRIPLASE
jgi:hypothetical protein